MKVKVNEAPLIQLNLLVAMCEGDPVDEEPDYASDWAHGGPIIESMRGLKLKIGRKPGAPCYAHIVSYNGKELYHQTGKTLLIAAMRCYVTSKLGDEVEIPEELL